MKCTQFDENKDCTLSLKGKTLYFQELKEMFDV